MGREELLAALRELSDRGHGAAGFKPHYVIEQEILAEFDRLNEIITNQSSLINNMGKRGATLQSHLDRISEPEQLYREKKAYICAGDIVKYDIHSRVKAISTR